LGWDAQQIVVIDSDLGQSGASAADREGFQRLVTEVTMGRAGIVLGLEVSRLARNSTDWHRLIELCAFTNTLILDEDGIYDPSQFNDCLVLGLKDTMSEAEPHFALAPARWNLEQSAARRVRHFPAGRLSVRRLPAGDSRSGPTGPTEHPPVVGSISAQRFDLGRRAGVPGQAVEVSRAYPEGTAAGRSGMG
jgi:DNA invertase Pin-like site-specific DNA recombinase